MHQGILRPSRDRGGAGVARLLAAVLAGSWRTLPPPLNLARAEWEAAAPRLLATGGGGLGWRRVRRSDGRALRGAVRFHQAYRLQTLRAGLHEAFLQQLFPFFRAAGIEPLLGKGWGVARLYPEPGLRPYEDFDLLVPAEQHCAARALLARPVAQQWPVDLHCQFPDLADRFWDDLYSRSRLVRLGEVEVRVLGPEDQLRHLCLHFLRHGAWRPLWLCDIGVALESQPAGFDWDCCLRGSRRSADAVACAIGLAYQLLGARVNDPGVARRAQHLPTWLVPAVLRQWVSPYWHHPGRPLADYLRHPAGLWRALRLRWPNPIEATVNLRGPFNELPRLPFQLVDCLVQLARFLVRLPQSLRKQPA